VPNVAVAVWEQVALHHRSCRERPGRFRLYQLRPHSLLQGSGVAYCVLDGGVVDMEFSSDLFNIAAGLCEVTVFAKMITHKHTKKPVPAEFWRGTGGHWTIVGASALAIIGCCWGLIAKTTEPIHYLAVGALTLLALAGFMFDQRSA
jgi:hypothetical protein